MAKHNKSDIKPDMALTFRARVAASGSVVTIALLLEIFLKLIREGIINRDNRREARELVRELMKEKVPQSTAPGLPKIQESEIVVDALDAGLDAQLDKIESIGFGDDEECGMGDDDPEELEDE